VIKRYPAHHTHLPLSLDVYNQLQWASCSTGYEKEDWEIATEAIDEWVRRNDPNALLGQAHAGYQWKRLFLPNGTVLRTVFGGQNHHCLVEGDRVVYDKRVVSPSGFVNAVGGVRRNAWKSTWILFPDSKEWQLADSLRTRVGPARARKVASTAQPEPPQSTAPAALDVVALAQAPQATQATQAAQAAQAPQAAAAPSASKPHSAARRARGPLAAFKARHTRHAYHIDHERANPAATAANATPPPTAV
jgi:hypothetical protein